jgi:hypothetical protein
MTQKRYIYIYIYDAGAKRERKEKEFLIFSKLIDTDRYWLGNKQRSATRLNHTRLQNRFREHVFITVAQTLLWKRSDALCGCPTIG